jgi:hypothetical protein
MKRESRETVSVARSAEIARSEGPQGASSCAEELCVSPVSETITIYFARPGAATCVTSLAGEIV